MAQPTPYTRGFNFSNFQAQNPDEPVPAGQLDNEFSALRRTLDEVLANLALIQRDDTALANRTVGFDQLKTEIEIGVNPPTTWVTARNYVARDTVFHQQRFYICLVSHLSGVFATDLAAGRWEQIADFTAAQDAVLVVYDNATSGLAATNMQDAMDELVASVLVTSVHGRVGDVVAVAGDYTASEVDFDATTLDHSDAEDVQAAMADLDAAITVAGTKVPTGTVLDFAGATAPAGYLFCFGQTVARATYADLFAVIGTTYGAGDGSTTFALPDLRGRVVAGQDDMGGTSANRLTSPVDGDALGAAGGSESHTLTESQMPAHTHSGTTSSDGAHSHTYGTNTRVQVGPDNGVEYSGKQSNAFNTSTDGAHTHTFTTSSVGGGAAHNNVQPTFILNKIIKV